MESHSHQFDARNVASWYGFGKPLIVPGTLRDARREDKKYIEVRIDKVAPKPTMHSFCCCQDFMRAVSPDMEKKLPLVTLSDYPITVQANEILGMVLPLVHGSHAGWKTSGNARLVFFATQHLDAFRTEWIKESQCFWHIRLFPAVWFKGAFWTLSFLLGMRSATTNEFLIIRPWPMAVTTTATLW